MSELMNARSGKRDLRWQLLTTVSTVALLAVMYGAGESKAADQDDDRPTVWIELGGQLEQLQDKQQPFMPPFVANMPSDFFSPDEIQRSTKYSHGVEGSIFFEPQGSDWVFSASVRVGRSKSIKHDHQQTPNAEIPVHSNIPFAGKYIVHTGYFFYPNGNVKFEDAQSEQSKTQTVLDFQAGKDVGLGMFGERGTSILSAGVRFAQFTSKTSVSLKAEPDVRYPTKPISSFAALRAFKYSDPIRFHRYADTANNERSFYGLGPSIAWSGSLPVVGDPTRGEVSFDWGANAAVLFGRRKAGGQQQMITGSYYGTHFDKNNDSRKPVESGYFFSSHNLGRTHYGHKSAQFNRARSVVVPNLGGMAGISFRYSNAKISLGYRADFFFGAMDGGIDVAKSETLGFFGPFATISIGLP